MRVGRPTSPMRALLPSLRLLDPVDLCPHSSPQQPYPGPRKWHPELSAAALSPAEQSASTEIATARANTAPSQRKTPGEPSSKNSVRWSHQPITRRRSSGLFECVSRAVACHTMCDFLGEVRKFLCLRDPELKLLARARVNQRGKF
jgi:hypothetical protein